jgi:hypothetical protein
MGGQPPLLPCTVVADHAFGVGVAQMAAAPQPLARRTPVVKSHSTAELNRSPVTEHAVWPGSEPRSWHLLITLVLHFPNSAERRATAVRLWRWRLAPKWRV